MDSIQPHRANLVTTIIYLVALFQVHRVGCNIEVETFKNESTIFTCFPFVLFDDHNDFQSTLEKPTVPFSSLELQCTKLL